MGYHILINKKVLERKFVLSDKVNIFPANSILRDKNHFNQALQVCGKTRAVTERNLIPRQAFL